MEQNMTKFYLKEGINDKQLDICISIMACAPLLAAVLLHLVSNVFWLYVLFLFKINITETSKKLS